MKAKTYTTIMRGIRQEWLNIEEIEQLKEIHNFNHRIQGFMPYLRGNYESITIWFDMFHYDKITHWLFGAVLYEGRTIGGVIWKSFPL